MDTEKDKYFTWDGSYLGQFTKKCVIKITKEEKLTYWKLELPDYNKITVIARKVEDSFQCVIDELKPIFGLVKLGTHRLKIGNKMYVIIRNYNAKFKFVSLKNISKSNLIFNLHVQDIFAFRELLAINSSFDSSICVRPVKKTVSSITSDQIIIYTTKQPVGFVENSTSLIKSALNIPDTVIHKWFTDKKCSLGTTIERLVSGNGDTIPEIISSVRQRLDDTIKRVDNEHIWMVSFIVNRLLIYLK